MLKESEAIYTIFASNDCLGASSYSNDGPEF